MTSRRAQRRLRDALRDAQGEPPRFYGQSYDPDLGTLDLFTRGPGVLIAVPAIDDRWPPEIKNAMERRRRANLDGTCDCGARGQSLPLRAGTTAHSTYQHEHDCPASDDALAELFRRHGIDPLAPPQ